MKKLPAEVGIHPEDGRRGQMDVVGCAIAAAQMNQVLSLGRSLAAPRAEKLRREHGWTEDTPLIAGICPHDDHTYAARNYALLLPHIRAKTVILFGVFHKARGFECGDRPAFDSFRAWPGPCGPVKVSPIREEMLARLPEYSAPRAMVWYGAGGG
ncbi:MAG: hypothetical protein ABIH26_06385 [Candidatus Eisenbacteria bacterium]